MKRYWLFAGDYYYPSGGMGDFVQDFDTAEEAIEAGQKLLKAGNEWAHYTDIEAKETRSIEMEASDE